MLSLKSLVNSIFYMEKSGENIYEQLFVRPYYAYYWKNKVSSLSSNDIRKMRLLFISFLQKNMKQIKTQ